MPFDEGMSNVHRDSVMNRGRFHKAITSILASGTRLVVRELKHCEKSVKMEKENAILASLGSYHTEFIRHFITVRRIVRLKLCSVICTHFYPIIFHFHVYLYTTKCDKIYFSFISSKNKYFQVKYKMN